MRTRSIILSVAALALSAATVAAQTAPAGQTAPAAGRGQAAAPTPASCGPNPPAELKNVGALGILIVILLVRPQGILGRAQRVG